MSVIGERVRQLRRSQDVTQVDLADAIGVTFTVISNIERGYSGAKPGVIERIAEYFNVPTDYILGRTNTRFRSTRQMSVVPARISALLEHHNIGPEDLSEESGMELSVITAMMNGETQPSLPDLAVISATLGTTIDYLMGNSDYAVGVQTEDENDIVEYYRQMDKHQKRLLMAELEKIVHMREVD